MIKKFITVAGALILAIIPAFSFVDVVENGLDGNFVKEAKALECLTGGEVIEIYPILSDTWSFQYTVRLDTSGNCKQAYAYTSDPWLRFIDQAQPDSCQGGYTRDYDASRYAGSNLPTDIPVQFTAVGMDFGGECVESTVSVTVRVMPETPTALTCTVNPNPMPNLNPGDSSAVVISTSAGAGFNSPVTFTSSITPSTGTPPSVSIDPSTNGRTPPATTTANVSSIASTTAGTYSITFTGTGGGETAQCSVQLTVNPAGRNFNLVIQPGTSTTGNPNATIVGNNYNYTVFAECTGGFTGPISNLVASTAFAGAVITFTNSGYPPPDNNRLAQLNCGATTPLVVNTSSIGAEQQSTPQNFLLRDITVTGEGQL